MGWGASRGEGGGHSAGPVTRTPPPSPPQGASGQQLVGGGGREALEGKGIPRPFQKLLHRRLEEVAKATGGGYCRL